MKLHKLPMERADIEALIPHRFPFLLIDRITALEPGKFIIAEKMVGADEPIFQGHFPGNPIYPGVYMIEGMAQTAAILGQFSNNVLDPKTLYLTEISSARFRKIIVPGDVLRYEVDFVKHRAPFFWFAGRAYSGSELAVQSNLSAKMR